MYVKAFVSETTDKACPGSWEKQPTSWGTAKDYRLGTSGGIRAFVFQGATETTPPWEQLTAQHKNGAASFT